MSQKITGKNLHYDQSLPPFLARLKGQHAGSADSPDPILASRRRAAKPRSASEEAEDAPVVVDDGGNVVAGLKVGPDGTVTGGEEDLGRAGGRGGEGEKDAEIQAEKDKEAQEAGEVTAIGGSKKRKAGKVIGADAEGEAQGDVPPKDRQASAKGASGVVAKKPDDRSRGPEKGRKKAKKIKLSFGDDDDGD